MTQWALPSVVPAREFEYFNPQKLVETSWLKDRLNRSQLRIIDFGRNIEDCKAGHIPDAVNINWINNLTDDDVKVFLPYNELRTLYENGLTQDKLYGFFCNCREFRMGLFQIYHLSEMVGGSHNQGGHIPFAYGNKGH